jgi:hypothetical protein
MSALGYAIRIIENYQLDIHERGLDREGFCQGAIYLGAIDSIRLRMRGVTEIDPGLISVAMNVAGPAQFGYAITDSEPQPQPGSSSHSRP